MHFRYWVLLLLPISAHCHPWKRINQRNFSVKSYAKHCRNQAVSFPSSPAREPAFASPEFPSGITFRSSAYLGGCSIPPHHPASPHSNPFFPPPSTPSVSHSSLPFLVSLSSAICFPSTGLLLIFLFLTFSLSSVALSSVTLPACMFTCAYRCVDAWIIIQIRFRWFWWSTCIGSFVFAAIAKHL